MASYCGKGAVGKVYKELRNGQWVAVKKVPGDMLTHYEVNREYEIHKAAEHPNTVKLVGIPSMYYDCKWHIPMEFIFGETLEKIMFHPRRSTIPLTPAIISKIITGMCEGLLHLHNNGIVHRDLKPDNIMVRSETFDPVIIDLGFAKFYRDGLNSGQNKGNTAYAAPEIVNMPWAERNPRSDVWAMGKIIAELLTGFRIPPMAINPAYMQETLRGNIYCDVVSRMLDGSPIPRATMAQVIGEIREAEEYTVERQSSSTPSSMQVQQYQSSEGGRERNRSLEFLPPYFRLPDSATPNCTVGMNYVKFDHEGKPASTVQGEARIRGGRMVDAWWTTVTPDKELDF